MLTSPIFLLLNFLRGTGSSSITVYWYDPALFANSSLCGLILSSCSRFLFLIRSKISAVRSSFILGQLIWGIGCADMDGGSYGITRLPVFNWVKLQYLAKFSTLPGKCSQGSAAPDVPAPTVHCVHPGRASTLSSISTRVLFSLIIPEQSAPLSIPPLPSRSPVITHPSTTRLRLLSISPSYSTNNLHLLVLGVVRGLLAEHILCLSLR